MSNDLILEKFMPYRLARLSSTVSTTIARAYDKEFGLSIPEWRVIAILGRYPGLSAVEVAEQTATLDILSGGKFLFGGSFQSGMAERRQRGVHRPGLPAIRSCFCWRRENYRLR